VFDVFDRCLSQMPDTATVSDLADVKLAVLQQLGSTAARAELEESLRRIRQLAREPRPGTNVRTTIERDIDELQQQVNQLRAKAPPLGLAPSTLKRQQRRPQQSIVSPVAAPVYECVALRVGRGR
jgi:hypothetical protein